MNKEERDKKIDLNELNMLKEAKGVGFHHYWFYKLEYLLWKEWDNTEDEKFKKYRITSKNSIEHISPQNHEFGKELEGESDFNWLDDFGNLGLLSVGQNSSYGNQSFIKKKEDFENKPVYDSLKLAKIYPLEKVWRSEEIRKHRDEMIKVLEEHYTKTSQQQSGET